MAKRDRLIEAISTGAVDAREVKADLYAAITKRDAIQAELAGADAEPKLIEPGMSERYRTAVGQSIDGFADAETQAEAIRCIRSLIDKIVVRPNAAGDDLDVDLHGALATILLLAIEDESGFVGKNVTEFEVKRAEARPRNRAINQRNEAKTEVSKVPVKHVSQEARAFAYDEMRRLIERNPEFEKLFVARGLRHPNLEVRWRKKP